MVTYWNKDIFTLKCNIDIDTELSVQGHKYSRTLEHDYSMYFVAFFLDVYGLQIKIICIHSIYHFLQECMYVKQSKLHASREL